MADVLDWSSAAVYQNFHNTTPKLTWTETNHGPVRCPTSEMLRKNNKVKKILLNINYYYLCHTKSTYNN